MRGCYRGVRGVLQEEKKRTARLGHELPPVQLETLVALFEERLRHIPFYVMHGVSVSQGQVRGLGGVRHGAAREVVKSYLSVSTMSSMAWNVDSESDVKSISR
jgi:hypothetical protein